MKKDKTKKGSGDSLRDKMLKRKAELERKGAAGGIIFPKDGVTRFRVKNPGDDAELAIEIVQFYLGGDMGGVMSPATFDEPCPFMEKYLELKDSKDDDDLELAKKLQPKRKFLLAIVGYKDEKGKEVDPDRVDKLCMIPRTAYQDIIDLFLDEDEWGDMTDPIEGYDIKLTRSGSGKNDTSYTIQPCQKKKMDKKYTKPVDLESMVRKQIPSYEELEDKLNKFLHLEGDEEDEAPKKKKKKSSKDEAPKKKKKSRYKSDI